MPIPVSCPRCGAFYQAPDHAAGQTIACTNCQAPFTVPLGQPMKPGSLPMAQPYQQPFAPQSPMPAMPPYPQQGMPPGQAPFPFPPPPSGGGSSVGVILIVVVVVLVLCGGGIAALLLPAIGSAREAARRVQCQNNLRQIAIALHSYHSAYQSFPPACVRDANGKPLYSWRVLILPYLELQHIYDQFDKNAAWDSPQNIALARMNFPPFQCPSGSGSPGSTPYQAIVGNDTLFEPDRGVFIDQVKDGTTNTVLVAEMSREVPWSSPQDTDLNAFIAEYLGQGPAPLHSGGGTVAMGDGSVRFLRQNEMDPATLRAIATRAGAEVIRLP